MITKFVPKLRFSEFSEEWEEKKLGEICAFEQGVQVDIGLQSKTPKDKYIKFLRIENYTQNSYDFRYIPIKLSNSKTIFKNEIAIVRYGASAGFIGRGYEGVLANNLFKLLPKGELENQYLYYFLTLEKTFKFFQERMVGGAMPALNFGITGNLLIPYSSKAEQQKIANFLSSVDTKIEQLSKKQNLLTQYKKGMMQKLFSQTIRFKADDGSDYPNWEEKRLLDISQRRSEKNKENLIHSVLTNSALDGIVNQRDYFDKDIANPNNLKGYYIVNKNDFIYNPRISKYAPVGPLNRNHLNIGVMSPLYSVFRVSEVNLDFIEKYFHTSIWHKYMFSIANYGARHDRMNVTNSDFFKLPVSIPSSEEQEKIANFLSSIDKKIEQINNQITQTKQFKKALLQQMFV
jgi:type I restriction enzyme S subunit